MLFFHLLYSVVNYPRRALGKPMSFGATVVVCFLSLLPLSALLLAFPAIVPQESVLTEAVGRRSWFRRTLSRLFAVMTGFVVLIALLAASIEIVDRLPLPEKG